MYGLDTLLNNYDAGSRHTTAPLIIDESSREGKSSIIIIRGNMLAGYHFRRMRIRALFPLRLAY